MYENKLIPILKGLNDVSDHILSSSVLTAEGLVLAAVPKDGVNEDKTGSLNASMYSLSQRALNEMEHGKLNQVLIKGDSGYVLMLEAGKEMTLSVRVDSQGDLERISHDAKHVAKNISNLI